MSLYLVNAVVSIVILAHNQSQYTRQCLLSVLESRPLNLELIVVDNGSTDETPRVLEKIAQTAAAGGVALQVLSPGENLGCSTARNMAVEKASGEEVVFLDNDTTFPDPAWLEKLQRILHTEENAAIVGPKLCYPFEPNLIQCAGVGISRSGRVLFRGRGEANDSALFNQREEVQCLTSACWMFRRSLYDEIGGLDEVFNPIQFEDLDFCYRARSSGYRVVYTPDPIVYHWESITSDRTPSLNNRYVIIRNGMEFKKRWRHMFEKEDGPSDAETRWKFMEMPSLEGRRRR